MSKVFQKFQIFLGFAVFQVFVANIVFLLKKFDNQFSYKELQALRNGYPLILIEKEKQIFFFCTDQKLSARSRCVQIKSMPRHTS